ncbi:MAG: MGMT family protein [Deltaproteobacteria bacterium]|nr:MGMT family protein [Deltaproteobacteria bacterium]
MKREPSNYERIWAAVKRVPRGKVATYGQIAVLAGLPGHARQVGYALFALPRGAKVPWQRVINARGEISARGAAEWEEIQRDLLEREGVTFDARGQVDLARFGWRPGLRDLPRSARGSPQALGPKPRRRREPATRKRRR